MESTLVAMMLAVRMLATQPSVRMLVRMLVVMMPAGRVMRVMMLLGPMMPGTVPVRRLAARVMSVMRMMMLFGPLMLFGLVMIVGFGAMALIMLLLRRLMMLSAGRSSKTGVAWWTMTPSADGCQSWGCIKYLSFRPWPKS